VSAAAASNEEQGGFIRVAELAPVLVMELSDVISSMGEASSW
jgi:hypothetical protein